MKHASEGFTEEHPRPELRLRHLGTLGGFSDLGWPLTITGAGAVAVVAHMLAACTTLGAPEAHDPPPEAPTDLPVRTNTQNPGVRESRAFSDTQEVWMQTVMELVKRRGEINPVTDDNAYRTMVDPEALGGILLESNGIKSMLNDQQWLDVQSLVEDLQRRSQFTAEISLPLRAGQDVFVSRNEAERTWPDRWEGFLEKYPDVALRISLSAPGFSQDRSSAVVLFVVGPVRHGHFGTAFFGREGDQWKLCWIDIDSYF